MPDDARIHLLARVARGAASGVSGPAPDSVKPLSILSLAATAYGSTSLRGRHGPDGLRPARRRALRGDRRGCLPRRELRRSLRPRGAARLRGRGRRCVRRRRQLDPDHGARQRSHRSARRRRYGSTDRGDDEHRLSPGPCAGGPAHRRSRGALERGRQRRRAPDPREARDSLEPRRGRWIPPWPMSATLSPLRPKA